MAKSIYRPSPQDGFFQYQDASANWHTITGVDDWSVSGGDRTSTQVDHVDSTSDVTVGAAGPKTFTLNMTPSYMNLYYQILEDDGLFGGSLVTVRYMTYAKSTPLATGTTGQTFAVDANGAITFVGTAGTKAAGILHKRVEYGILAGAAAADITQTDNSKNGNLYIVDDFPTSGLTGGLARKWNLRTYAALTATEHWKLIEYGMAYEYGQCYVINMGDVGGGPAAASTDTIVIQQSVAGKTRTPIVQVAS